MKRMLMVKGGSENSQAHAFMSHGTAPMAARAVAMQSGSPWGAPINGVRARQNYQIAA